MASQLATGAVHLFVRTPGTSSPSYLGTAERFPNDTRSPEYEPVYNDISGTRVPLDFAWELETATISCTLTRWTEALARLLESKPRFGNDGNAPGAWNVVDVGSLMALEGLAVEIWTAYTFGSAIANKAAYTSLGLMPGRHYLQCLVWSPESDEKGTQAMKRTFMFYAWPKLTSGSNYLNTRFVLYDQAFPSGMASLIS